MAKILTVALINSDYKLTGGVKRIFNIAHPLRERGYQVQLYSPSLAMPSWSEHQDFTVRSLDESLRDETDCAIFFNPKCIPYRYLAKNPATHKVIYFLLNGGHYKQSYQRWINRTQRLPDVCLAGNNGRWRNQYKLRGKQDFDLIGGIDLEHFTPPVEARQRRDPGERLTVITQGRDPSNFKGKGTNIIIKELEALSERIRLVIFSNKRVGCSSRKIELTEVVAIPPSEMPELYRSADLLIQNEDDAGGWSNTAAEAMACGTPIICTPYTTSDFVEQLKTCFVIERRSGAMREAVEYLLDRPKLLEEMAVCGHQRIQNFSWESVADQLEEMFRVLAKKSTAELAAAGSGFRRMLDRWSVGF
ncbi:MAG: glycosyltransferase family 4 protein [Myxococcales bacterium]|nr:glycosyltransferase family 4 protein [Myxococcales bacterium]